MSFGDFLYAWFVYYDLAPIVVCKNGEEHLIHSVIDFPDHTDATATRKVERYHEPVVQATILSPDTYTGAIMNLCTAHRGTNVEFSYLDTDIARPSHGPSQRVKLVYSMPLSSIITGFYSTLKSITSGFASLDYENAGYQPSDLVKLLILINGKPVDALNSIVHRSEAEKEGRATLTRLKELVARQQFEVSRISFTIADHPKTYCCVQDYIASVYRFQNTRSRAYFSGPEGRHRRPLRRT